MERPFAASISRLWFPAFLALALLSEAGCVERILQVRSDPPGAKVYVNGDEVGTTPCDHPFTFYGTVDVTVRAPGYLSHRELKTLSPPWYQFFPIDFVTDLLVPFGIRDAHTVTISLQPSPTEVTPALRRDLEEKTAGLRTHLPPPSKPVEEPPAGQGGEPAPQTIRP